MTDAHCHIARGETRHLLCDPASPVEQASRLLRSVEQASRLLRSVEPASRLPDSRDVFFYGTHPWYLDTFDAAALRARLAANPAAGVGEIGLDRLREKTISPRMRDVFETQLKIAAEFRRPVVLHGAKCWGEVVKTILRLFPVCEASRLLPPPAFLFHGFSRSGGLLPDIIKLNGFISVGPALLNDHAVNYRELVKAIPLDRLLVESDATVENAAEVPSVKAIAAKLADLRGLDLGSLTAALEANLVKFLSGILA